MDGKLTPFVQHLCFLFQEFPLLKRSFRDYLRPNMFLLKRKLLFRLRLTPTHVHLRATSILNADSSRCCTSGKHKTIQLFSLQIFIANENDFEVADIRFPTAVDARYLRVVPVTWNYWIAMRLEVIGFNCSCPLECSYHICEQGSLRTTFW